MYLLHFLLFFLKFRKFKVFLHNQITITLQLKCEIKLYNNTWYYIPNNKRNRFKRS